MGEEIPYKSQLNCRSARHPVLPRLLCGKQRWTLTKCDGLAVAAKQSNSRMRHYEYAEMCKDMDTCTVKPP